MQMRKYKGNNTHSNCHAPSVLPMLYRYQITGGFPGGAVVRNPPANAGDKGSSPGPGRSHMPRSN